MIAPPSDSSKVLCQGLIGTRQTTFPVLRTEPLSKSVAGSAVRNLSLNRMLCGEQSYGKAEGPNPGIALAGPGEGDRVVGIRERELLPDGSDCV